MKSQTVRSIAPWSVFSITGIVVSFVVGGLVPKLVHASSWNGLNNPRNWQAGMQYRFDALPTEGKMRSHTPWSDTYWPSNQAGIAKRWNWKGARSGFKYKTYSESAVRKMTVGQLAALSPAEKYDIFMGRFDYPTVDVVRDNTSSGAPYWAGICNGWSPAALNHAEPAAVTLRGPSGIEVPFGSADVKGLLDQHYANNADAKQFLGGRCKRGGFFGIFASKSACQDVNAGAFHIVLTNHLGIQHKGFVADVDRGKEVWNQPVYAYTTQVKGYRHPSPKAARGTVREVIVHTVITYADEIEATWTPVVGTPANKSDTATYDYALELDVHGNILGGSYLPSNPAHPDFLWNAPALRFTGRYSGLNQIYRAATN